ncbi:MAG TPA: NAD(P)-dependent oxidoreductase [Thermoplasmata archaeon]|nr:NAD(P)-dependent oxidoreductase [Thermoplasmata archaeon]
MVRIGITGATGFIGGALVSRLGDAGFELVTVDNRTGPVLAEHPAWPVPNLDFASDEALRLLSSCQVVLHLAAASGVMKCANDPQGTALVNVDGTARLFGMCAERRIPVAFASSFAVVGAPESLPVREDTPARPTHEYARQKARGEELTRALSLHAGLPSAILRQSNVYGHYLAGGRRISKGNVIEAFAGQARDGRLMVNAPGTQQRDFVHIDDVVAHWEAAARFLTRPDAPRACRTFNVASGEALSVLEVAELVVRVFSRGYPDRAPLRADIVANPRGGVELVEPTFRVDRSETERELGVACRHRLESEIPAILEAQLGRSREP